MIAPNGRSIPGVATEIHTTDLSIVYEAADCAEIITITVINISTTIGNTITGIKNINQLSLEAIFLIRSYAAKAFGLPIHLYLALNALGNTVLLFTAAQKANQARLLIIFS